MALRILAVIVCGLAIVPMAAGGTLRFDDPIHDIMVTRNTINMPVDSIDIIAYQQRTVGGALRSASIEVLDLSRMGLEDRVFVQSAHSMRLFGFTEIYEQNFTIIFIALQMDAQPEIESLAVLAWPGGARIIDHESELDLSANTVSWAIKERHPGTLRQRFAVTGLAGCDDFETCQAKLPRLTASDVAPNELADPLAELSPELFWSDLFPEEDGSIPKAPISLAPLTDS